MSSVTSSEPTHEPRNVSSRRLSKRFELVTQLQQERREKEARNAVQQRVEEAQNVLRRNLYLDLEAAIGEVTQPRSACMQPSARRSLTMQSESVKIPGSRNDSTISNQDGMDNSNHHPAAGEDNDEAARSQSSKPFYTAASSPPTSPRSDTSIETEKDIGIGTGRLEGAEENKDEDIDDLTVEDPRIRTLVQELQEVQEDQRLLQRDLVEAKREINDLRKQVYEAEEKAIRDAKDVTQTEEYQNLLSILRQVQDQRRELQDRLDEAEEKERELQRQLRQARRDLDENEDRMGRLNDELSAAKSERDLHAQTVTALQFQLNDLHRQHGVQAGVLDRLAAELDRRNQDRDMYERRVAQLQEDIHERRLEVARPTRRGRRVPTEYMVDDDVPTRKGVTEYQIKDRKSIEVEKRNGQLCKVRRLT